MNKIQFYLLHFQLLRFSKIPLNMPKLNNILQWQRFMFSIQKIQLLQTIPSKLEIKIESAFSSNFSLVILGIRKLIHNKAKNILID